MKKIFYFIASAIVALGAVACQNEIDENIDNNQQTEGYSIKVTIDEQTRVALGEAETDSEGNTKRKLTFTEGDVLVARANWQRGTNYLFKYTKAEGDVYTFTCTADGVSELIDTNPFFFYLGGLHEQANELTGYGSVCNTAAENISGIGMYANDTCQSGKFGDEDYEVSLIALPLLKFTAYEPVTFKSTNSSQFFADNEWKDSYTTKKTDGEIYLPILPSSGECTISVTTESGFNKSFTKELIENKIYNLGTIEAPAPAPKHRVYVIAQPKSAQAAWTKVNFYTWDVDPLVAWPGADITNQKETINGYTYNYYEYPETWTGKNVNVIINNGTAQTSDIALGKLDKNYYVVYNTDATIYTEAPAAGSIKEAATQSSEWALAGDFNSWGDKVMEVVAGANNLFVAKNVAINAYTKIKVKKVGTWDVSYGGGINYLNANNWMTVYDNGADIQIVTKGTYDVYFDKANTKLYLMTAGTAYNTAKEQSKDGPAPDASKYAWGLCGAHNGWGNNDTALTWDDTCSLFVAKNAKLSGEFKVRADKAWTVNYGGKTITVDAASGTTLTKNSSGNCKLNKYGTFDVYFQYISDSNVKIWVKTPGSAAPAL